MGLTAPIRATNRIIDRWLTERQPHARQSLGIFRILYSVFYLWILSFQHARMLAGLPSDSRSRIVLVLWFPFDAPPLVFGVLEMFLVAALVLLLFGWQTRLATAAVLVFGAVLEALLSVGDKENGTVFVTFFIPGFMLLAGCPWGDAYSLDAARRPGQHNDGNGDSGHYVIPGRAALALLVTLFVSAGISKVAGDGVWLRHPKLMAHFMLYHNIESVLMGLPPNPHAPLIAQTPAIHVPIHFSVLLFEVSFLLALFSPRLRQFYLAGALLFQTINSLWFVVTFTPLIITYCLFVDWESLKRRFLPERQARSLSIFRSRFAPIAVCLLAAGVAITWDMGRFTRSIFSAGGMIDWRSIFWPILPLALWLVARTSWQLLSPWIRLNHGVTATAASGAPRSSR